MHIVFKLSHKIDLIQEKKFKVTFGWNFLFFQKLKDVAFPQAEILKKALLRRFDQEYAQYLVKKVTSLSAPHTQ